MARVGFFLVRNSIAAGFVCLSKLMLTVRNLLGLLLLVMRTGLLRIIAILEFSIEMPSQDKRHDFRGGPWVSETFSVKSFWEARASFM